MNKSFIRVKVANCNELDLIKIRSFFNNKLLKPIKSIEMDFKNVFGSKYQINHSRISNIDNFEINA